MFGYSYFGNCLDYVRQHKNRPFSIIRTYFDYDNNNVYFKSLSYTNVLFKLEMKLSSINVMFDNISKLTFFELNQGPQLCSINAKFIRLG